MSTRPFRYFCVYGHFDQPPRGNPVTGEIGSEPGLDSFRNWNERITAESYRPNAEMGNFDRISFDIGESLMEWLQRRAPETYHRIVQADSIHQERKKIGNAAATSMFHVILPLARRRDKQTQLSWGWAAFRHHFGRDPQGLWLPEIAVDLETLQVAEALGYRYTVLSRGQVQDGIEDGGPYWVDLENGRRIAIFVRNDALSNDLSFNIAEAGGAGYWARHKLSGHHVGTLTLLAVGGETFGYHHMGEEKFLHWLVEHEAPAVGYRITTLDEYLRDFPPHDTITIKPFTSWSCYHGVARWMTGCACTPGDSTWKAALRRALDNAASNLDDAYQDVTRPLGIDPWQFRNDYIHAWLGEMTDTAFLAEHATSLTTEVEQRLTNLLRAEVSMARSYTSYAFFYEDFDRAESRYAVASAAYALHLAEQATGARLGDQFRTDLYMVRSERTKLNGAQIYDETMQSYIRSSAYPVE